MVGPGPADWFITTDDRGRGTAWNMATNPPTERPLDQSVMQIRPGPGKWIVLDSGSGSESAWNLTTSPPAAWPLGPHATDSTVRFGDWLVVKYSGDRSATAWHLSASTPQAFVPPRTVSVGTQAVDAWLSSSGRWAVVTLTGESVEQLVVVSDLAKLTTPLPRDAIDDPVAYACGLVGRGLTRAEWAKYAPGVGFRETCSKGLTGPDQV